jgi:hypothetical protein
MAPAGANRARAAANVTAAPDRRDFEDGFEGVKLFS